MVSTLVSAARVPMRARPGRIGATVANWYADRAKASELFDIEIIDLAEIDLPLMDEPHHPKPGKYTHVHTKRWSQTVQRADAYVFVVPEYNYGFNAATKNALDYLHAEWADKPVGFVSYGGVAAGTRAVQMLKQVVTTLRMIPVFEAVNIPFVQQFIEDGGTLAANDVMDFVRRRHDCRTGPLDRCEHPGAGEPLTPYRPDANTRDARPAGKGPSGRLVTMELRVFTEPQQGATYDDLLAVAQAAERLGFGAFFRSDHYLAMGGDGLPGPTDAWTTLAGIARETHTIGLGTLMTSATFRAPGVLAIQAAQVDQMSGGRVELGLGAGWFEQEHTAYGIEFTSTLERFDRFAEQLAIITGLWQTPRGETFSFDGSHYQLTDSPALPKPVQSPRPPVLIGGFGKKRTPALAAQYADEFNVAFGSLEQNIEQFTRVRAACEAIGRDPDDLTYSSALVLCCGANEAEIKRRAAAIGREPAELRANGLAGTPDEVIERIGHFAQAGSQRAYLQTLDLSDLEHLELVAAEVMPHV